MKKFNLLNLEKYIRDNHLLDEERTDKFMTMLKYSGKEMLIYPGYVMKELDTTSNIVYKMLRFLKGEGLIKEKYEIKCKVCNTYQDTIYESIEEISRDLDCIRCGNRIDKDEDYLVIYKIY